MTDIFELIRRSFIEKSIVTGRYNTFNFFYNLSSNNRINTIRYHNISQQSLRKYSDDYDLYPWKFLSDKQLKYIFFPSMLLGYSTATWIESYIRSSKPLLCQSLLLLASSVLVFKIPRSASYVIHKKNSSQKIHDILLNDYRSL